ncbi:MAG: ABC transporter ATP-binding protein [Marinilabiliaceae bacterium]|nr:ABC transporter ATP-binding protein [Marinilabiliaceae bacterium]
MIEVRNLKKQYGDLIAVNDVSFSVNEGELFGVIGPDGAGKTTLFRMINSLIIPDSGSVSLWGLNPVTDYKAIREMIGYMPGRFSLYEDLSVEENLEFFATVFGTTIEENYHLIKDIYAQIEPFKKRKAGQLSGGMKQKLALSCALIHKPRILVLDEPTTGVDAVSRYEFWDMLIKLKQNNITILVSTPYMDEASKCDRVALMQNGHVLMVDTPWGIENGFSTSLYGLKTINKYKLIQFLRSSVSCKSVYPFGEYLHYCDKREDVNEKILIEELKQAGFFDAIVDEVKPGIEDRFMELMGNVI